MNFNAPKHSEIPERDYSAGMPNNANLNDGKQENLIFDH